MLLAVVLLGAPLHHFADEERLFVYLRFANKKLEFSDFYAQFDILYFLDLCVYDDKDFERRFLMPRYVFDCLLEGILRRCAFLQRSVIHRSL